MPVRESPATGDPNAKLEQVFRGDHAVIKHSLLEDSGIPKIQPVLRKNWTDKQARNVIMTLAPVEVEDPNLELPSAVVVLQTGPVTGLLTWGIEGGDAKQVEFDWGSAIYNLGGLPDGRGSGLQLCFPASYVQLDARNYMGTAIPVGGFPDEVPAGVPITPANAILRAFLTVGAATQRLTPITRTFWQQTPVTPGSTFSFLIPPMAKRVRVGRFPANSMTVEVSDSFIAGNLIDQIVVPAGELCPFIDLTSDAVSISFSNTGIIDIFRARIIFELAI